jgi:7-carboxy-7-deazaguanine synthase
MKKYKVKELFYTLQGEGGQAGRAAVFCRFTGCNLWTGRERDRPKAICQFCDTDFVGTDGVNGGTYTAKALAQKAAETWGDLSKGKPYIVCTGGEPALQLDLPLIEALHDQGFEIAIETNGTIELPQGIDWICLSPKANTEIVVAFAHEIKLVYPQQNALPVLFETGHFDHFYLQPMDGTDAEANTKAAVAYCLANPIWKLSLQTHKLLGIP